MSFVEFRGDYYNLDHLITATSSYDNDDSVYYWTYVFGGKGIRVSENSDTAQIIQDYISHRRYKIEPK